MEWSLHFSRVVFKKRRRKKVKEEECAKGNYTYLANIKYLCQALYRKSLLSLNLINFNFIKILKNTKFVKLYVQESNKTRTQSTRNKKK